MSTTLKRTSMALDAETLESLEYLSQAWGTSKAEVIRRVIKKTSKQELAKKPTRTPLEALQWLQTEGGLPPEVADKLQQDIQAERLAKKDEWKA